MRLFIAVDIPKEIKEKIRTSFLYSKDTLEFARFTDPENLHITLVFLGEIPESLVASVKVVMERVARVYAKSQLMITGAVIGPDKNLARMIWLKLDTDSQKYLEKITGDLKNNLKKENIPFYNTHETSNGHVTLARFDQRWQDDFQSRNDKNRNEELEKIKNSLPESFQESFYIKSIILFLSSEKNRQRIYEPLFESEFKR